MGIDSHEVVAEPGTGASSTGAAPRHRIAIIDSDSGFVRVLTNRLDGRGWRHRALTRPAAVEALVAMRLNALVIDLSLLGPDAWRYLEQIQARLPALVVIVCTASSSVAQRVRGLRAGADVWLTKPVHPEELIALVESALRRARRTDMPVLEEPSEVGEISIRPDLHQAYRGEESIELTAREFEILQLLSGTDRVLRREEIYERVWGYAMAHGDRSVDVFVRKLRQKLRAASPSWNYIHTHFGVGYRFGPEPEGDLPAGAEDGPSGSVEEDRAAGTELGEGHSEPVLLA